MPRVMSQTTPWTTDALPRRAGPAGPRGGVHVSVCLDPFQRARECLAHGDEGGVAAFGAVESEDGGDTVAVLAKRRAGRRQGTTPLARKAGSSKA